MVGRVLAVELALRAVDDQGRVADPRRAGRARPGGPARPRARPIAAGSLRANSRLAQSASARVLRRRPAGRRSPGRRRARSSRNRRGSRRCAPRRPRAKGRGPIRRRCSTRAVMSTTTAPAKRRAAGPVSTCQRTVAPSDQPTPIAPRRSSASASSATSAAICSTLGRSPPPRDAPWPRRSIAISRKSSASARLLAEEAAMRHQPVQQHERGPAPLVAIGDPRAVRCGEKLQTPLPGRRSFESVRPGRSAPI